MATSEAQTDTTGSTTILGIVNFLSMIQDENALYNTYPAQGTSRIRSIARASSLHELEETAYRYKAKIVIIDDRSLISENAVKAFSEIVHRLRHYAEYPIITVGVCYDPLAVEVFRRAGAFITVRGPLTPIELQLLSDELPVAMMEAVQERLSPTYSNHFSREAMELIMAEGWQGHTLSVWSTKGGVGKSFLAREIAVGLGVLCGLRVLLIDADMNCADQHTYLNISPDKNLHGLASAYHAQNGRLTPQMVEDFLVRYDGNLFVLNGLWDMAMTRAEYLRGTAGEKFANALMDVLPQMGFAFVVYDLGQNYHDGLHLVALQRCSLNLIVATAEKSTANEMEQAIKDLRASVNYGNVRFRLVLNKWDDRLGINANEIQQRLGVPLIACVPYGNDLKVDLSLNYSKPMMLGKSNEVSDAIAKMIAAFYPGLAKVWEKRGGPKPRKRFRLFSRKGIA